MVVQVLRNQQQELSKSIKKPPAWLEGFALRTLALLSINLIFFALIVPILKDTPLVYIFQHASLHQSRSQTEVSPLDHDPISLIRGYKVLPPLTSLRTVDGTFDLVRRSTDGPILYYGVHVLPAVIWSISMPLQHVKRIRAKYPALHRFSGYLSLSCSLILSISGFLIPRRGLNYRHPDYWHLHVFRFRGVPLFACPNFSLQTDLLTVLVLFTAYKTLVYARQRDWAMHRFWAQLHTYIGYSVPMQRVWMYVLFGIGLVLPLLPAKVLAMMNYPLTDADIHRAEVGAFANTVLWTYVTIALLVYRDWRAPRAKKL